MNILKSALWTLTYILVINIAGLWPWPLEEYGFRWHFDYYELIQGLCQLIAICILLFIILKTDLKHYLASAPKKWYYIAILTGVAFVFLQSPLKLLYNFIFQTDYFIKYDFDGFQYLKNPNVITTVLLIPIGEELFFRGFIQGKLLKNELPIIAILLSSLLFASIHAPYETLILSDYEEGWHLFYLTLFGGIFLSLLYNKTRSLFPSIIFHASWNFAVIII